MAGGSQFPYREPRRGQLEAAAALAETVRGGGVFILSAPTGFGKTATVVKGLLDAGAEAVMYVVRTRNEIAPVVRELRRFGVEDFVFLYSARRMCPLLGGEGLGLHEFWETCRVLRLAGRCTYYARVAELDPDSVRELVSVSESPFRVVDQLASMGYCPFFALRLAVAGSRFIVATYPYLFRRDIFEGTMEPYSYEDLVVVVDEAHSLFTPGSLVEARVSIADLRRAMREVEEHGLPGELADRLRELEALASGAAQGLVQGLRRLPLERLRRLLEDPSVWSDAAYEVRLARLREALEAGAEGVRVALSRVEELAYMAFQEGVAAYVYRENGRVGVTVLPLDPCTVAGEPLGRARAVVLVSGTMPPEGFVRDALCLGDRRLVYYDVELLHGSPLPPENQYTIAVVELTSRYTSRSPSMYLRYAEYIGALVEAVNRSVLVVYPSYEFMSSIAGILSERLAGRAALVVEDRSTTIDEVAEKARRGKTVINAVAGGKLSEGVEIVDAEGRSLIGSVFVAGVPYPQPDDYFEDQLRRLAGRMGERAARRFMFDVLASIRVRQAVGRARRGPGDRALIVLGDHRFLRRSLRELLRLRIDMVSVGLEDFRAAVREAATALGV
ncbi:MAG: ATP-dependent DNA helicase [Crenarchaeota archaeon]|nr:ATP-dependent DNA helicase [Thermoproteota archaeon]